MFSSSQGEFLSIQFTAQNAAQDYHRRSSGVSAVRCAGSLAAEVAQAMQAIITSVIVFGCTFGSLLFGLFLRARLPDRDFIDKPPEVVKLGLALISLVAALLLSLQLSSAKASFDALSDELNQISGNVMLLDRTLARYGPEAQPLREMIKVTAGRALEGLWPSEPKSHADVTVHLLPEMAVYDGFQTLSPKTETQQLLKTHAIETAFTISRKRFLIVAQQSKTVNFPMMVLLIFWLTIVFVSYGIFAPRKSGATVFLCVFAAALSGAVFLLFELYTPFSGVLRISDAALRTAIAQLGH